MKNRTSSNVMSLGLAIKSVVFGISLTLLLLDSPSAAAQVAGGDSDRDVKMARGYMRERRFQEALEAFGRAYNAKPNVAVLAEMVPAYLALGMSTEAQDVVQQVYSQGGDISLPLWHWHGWRYCYGTLYIGPKAVRWQGKDAKDQFQVKPQEIERAKMISELDGGSVNTPEFIVRTLKKNWRFEFLLYGFSSYETNSVGNAVYYGDDQSKAEKATDFILQLLALASATQPNASTQFTNAGEGRPSASSSVAPPEPAQSTSKAPSTVGGMVLLAQDPRWVPLDEPFQLDERLKDQTRIGFRDLSRQQAQVSLEEEITIGRRLARELENQVKLTNDPGLIEYVSRIGQNIARNSDAKVPFTFKTVETDLIGIWPLPGGFVYVSTGLILMAEGEAELAFILAHGIGHVAGCHYSRYRQNLSNLSLNDLLQAGLPTVAEAESDLLALQYLYRTAYDPSACLSFVENVREVLRQQSSSVAQSSAMHVVLTPRRLSAAQDEIAHDLPLRDQYVNSTSEFVEIKARLVEVAGKSEGKTKPVELQEGQTPEEVEKILGKPEDTTALQENLIYSYPTVKVFFKNGKLVNVEERKH